MQSHWKRCGRILGAEMLPGSYRLTQIPTAWFLPDGLLRIAFSARDKNNHGQLLAVDVDADAEMRIVREHFQPLISLDHCPDFAKDGIGPGDAIYVDGKLYLYCTSLNLDALHYDCSIVLLVSEDHGLNFKAPLQVLGPHDNNGFPVAQPSVTHLGDSWHLWYTALQQWITNVGPHPDSRYQIHHATSTDGRVWHPDHEIAVGFSSAAETGLARPSVLESDDFFEMWFSSRGPFSEEKPKLRNYKIAYAVSKNGLSWQRRDETHRFINPPESGDWDDEMQCYPNVFKLKDGRTCMLYCGNGYGANGFGYAIRIDT